MTDNNPHGQPALPHGAEEPVAAKAETALTQWVCAGARRYVGLGDIRAAVAVTRRVALSALQESGIRADARMVTTSNKTIALWLAEKLPELVRVVRDFEEQRKRAAPASARRGEGPMMTATEVYTLFRCGKDTLEGWMAHSGFPAPLPLGLGDGARRRWSRKAVTAWLDALTTPGGAE